VYQSQALSIGAGSEFVFELQSIQTNVSESTP